MKRLTVVAAIVSVCLVGAAGAQIAQQAEPFAAQFDAMPEGHDFARNYPNRALDRDIEGAAILCCVPREDGFLNCSAAFEWPEGYGFGEASVRVASKIHLSPESNAAFRATPGNWIRRTMIWRLNRGNANEWTFSRISEASEQFCRPPVVGAQPSTEVPAESNAQ